MECLKNKVPKKDWEKYKKSKRRLVKVINEIKTGKRTFLGM